MQTARMTLVRELNRRLPKRGRHLMALAAMGKRQLLVSGWWRSFREQRPVDRAGEPLPWLTYSFIDFVEPRIPADAVLFEYGMGNSTLWWSKRVAHVDTCEGHQGWYDRIVATMPPNVNAQRVDVESDAYPNAARLTGRQYDIVVIDGRRRVESAISAVETLTPRGVLVWDNSDRAKYQAGYDHLIERGFRRLDFTGLAPQIGRYACTSLFYRDGNCLGV